MKEREDSQHRNSEVMLSALHEQTRNILVLHFKQGFTSESISDILSIEYSEVECIIRNFASAFSSEELMMNVINGLVIMNAKTRMKKNITKPSPDDRDEEIAELRRQLTQAQIKAEFYEEMIRVAEDRFRISIRKKPGAKQ